MIARQMFLSAVALAVACVAAAVSASPAAAADKVRIGIPGLSPNSAFFMVAVEKGYYKEEGIEVEALMAGGEPRSRRSCPAICSSAPRQGLL